MIEDPGLKRQLVGRIATIIGKMDECKNIFEAHGITDEEPHGWNNFHQDLVRWYMDHSR